MIIRCLGFTLDVRFYRTPTLEQKVLEVWEQRGRVEAIRFFRSNAEVMGTPSLKDAIEYCNRLVDKYPAMKYVGK